MVLIHMVGISRNLPKITSKRLSWNVGIVGVHPQHIYSEYLDLAALQPGFSAETAMWNDAILDTPFWLLDEIDGKCFGPLGKFAECGDATLWRIRRGRRRVHGKNADEIVYALQVVDVIESQTLLEDSSQTSSGWKKVHPAQIPFNLFGNQEGYNNFQRRQEQLRKAGQFVQKDQECLITSTSTSKDRRQQESDGASEMTSDLQLGPCTSARAWTWRVNEQGVLLQDEGLASLSKVSSHGLWAAVSSMLWSAQATRYEAQHDNLQGGTNQICLRREISGQTNQATLSSCDASMDQSRLVSFSFARFGPASTTPPTPKIGFVAHPNQGLNNGLTLSDSSSPSAGIADGQEVLSPTTVTEIIIHPPKIVGSEVVVQPVTNFSRLPSASAAGLARAPVMGSKIASSQKGGSTNNHKIPPHPLTNMNSLPVGSLTKSTVNLLKDSHPGLIQNSEILKSGLSTPPQHSKIHVDAADRKIQKNQNQVGVTNWKIPRHPYIDASKNFVWRDPATGLEYFTDLCKYLGEEKSSSGRHTLVGVGQYMRTALKIKIYGAALYVSKRDVLSGSIFGKYAHLPAEQLKKRPDFYQHLMEMDPNHGFDRTLLIKTNMQLSTETMRSSLKADWRLLSEEQKDMLINSSMKPRPAENKMLDLIKSEANSSNCSCGQIAPEEYKADPTCCARGTEVAFTWRKNDDLEVRLDGRLMDRFSVPNLAKGIFYEYLRADDPISPDARDHFVDGFPFLLAPLAQIRGVVSQAHIVQDNQENDSSNASPLQVFSFVSKLMESASHVAGSTLSMVQESAAGTLKGTVGASKFVGKKMRDAGGDINRRTEVMGEQITSMTLGSIDFLVQHVPFIPTDLRQKMRSHHGNRLITTIPAISPSLRGSIIGSELVVSPFFGDEIAMILSPDMDFRHRVFLTSVHLYLMLLLIVSLPGSHSTRSVIKRQKDKQATRTKSIVKGDMTGFRKPVQVKPPKEAPPGPPPVRIKSRNNLLLSKKPSQCFTIPEEKQASEPSFYSSQQSCSTRATGKKLSRGYYF